MRRYPGHTTAKHRDQAPNPGPDTCGYCAILTPEQNKPAGPLAEVYESP